MKRRAGPNFRKKDSPTKLVSSKYDEQPKKPSKPSKWMIVIVKKQFEDFARRLDELETKKRVQALRQMRLEFKRRVTLVQLLYRHRKFGEEKPSLENPKKVKAVPKPPKEPKDEFALDSDLDDFGGNDSEEERKDAVWKELGGEEAKARLQRIEEMNRKHMQIADRLLGKKKDKKLDEIQEDPEDEGLETQKDVNVAVCNKLLGLLVDFEMQKIAWASVKLSEFCKMWIARRQYMRTRLCVIVI